jgi:predicted ATP-grasp superfamily ATP-dependent carboligase
MDFIMTDVLSGELVPVLLGMSAEANETARRMYRQYGVVSHVFCDRIPLSMRLSLSMKFHIIRHSAKNDRLMLQALADYADQLGNKEIILYLIPCTEHYANMIWHNRDELERSFVIADKPEMEKVWFGEKKSAQKEDRHDNR